MPRQSMCGRHPFPFYPRLPSSYNYPYLPGHKAATTATNGRITLRANGA